jgi:hypothetical protein
MISLPTILANLIVAPIVEKIGGRKTFAIYTFIMVSGFAI